MLDFDKVLGFGLQAVLEISQNETPEAIPVEVIVLAEAREEARKNKEWDKADALRKEIADRGYEVKDTEGGAKLTKL